MLDASVPHPDISGGRWGGGRKPIVTAFFLKQIEVFDKWVSTANSDLQMCSQNSDPGELGESHLWGVHSGGAASAHAHLARTLSREACEILCCSVVWPQRPCMLTPGRRRARVRVAGPAPDETSMCWEAGRRSLPWPNSPPPCVWPHSLWYVCNALIITSTNLNAPAPVQPSAGTHGPPRTLNLCLSHFFRHQVEKACR